MATIKFYLQTKNNPANIYARLSISRGVVFVRKTNHFVDPADWSPADGLPRENDIDLKNLKVYLTNMAADILTRVNESMKRGEEITGDWLQDSIDAHQGRKKKDDTDRLTNHIQYYIDNLQYKEYSNGRRGASYGTIKKYTTLRNKLVSYEAYKKHRYYVKDFDLKFRNELVKYFREVDKLGVNTTGLYIKLLKIICRDADKTGIEVNRQLSQIKGFTEKTEKIYLSFDELEKIENTPFTRPALENARDWLIIGCYIGQRVGDLMKLTTDNIVNRAGLELIELTQEKTGKNVSIPVHDKVRAILNKRNGRFPYEVSNQRFNEYIKDVCKLAGLTQVITGGRLEYCEDSKLWRKNKSKYEKWELITSHVCRRSFASNFYGTVPTALLISITAHSTEKQFLEYIGKTTNDYAVQIATYFRQMEMNARKETQLTVVKSAK